MQPTVDLEVLNFAMANALRAAGLGDDGESTDVVDLISCTVSGTRELGMGPDSDLGWWRPTMAIIDPLIKLTATVMNNPLGDNSEVALEAIEKMRTEIQAHKAGHLQYYKTVLVREPKTRPGRSK